jgi:hypothetical protein
MFGVALLLSLASRLPPLHEPRSATHAAIAIRFDRIFMATPFANQTSLRRSHEVMLRV